MTDATLADIQKQDLGLQFESLDWVGMEEIGLPIRLKSVSEHMEIPTKVDAMVDLVKSSQRGIHMSRLYLLAQEKLTKSSLSLADLGQVASEFLSSQEGLSTRAMLRLRFDLPLLRASLKSENKAYKTYPVEILVLKLQGKTRFFMKVCVKYSSTCPASAALARQLIQQQFEQDFSSQEQAPVQKENVKEWLGSTLGIVATPHAQRSEGSVQVEIAAGSSLSLTKLIDLIEDALQTPVQAAVKRVDEQEFALRNGQNLMFCEDAARRVRGVLEREKLILDFYARFIHFESLHPHNAVSRVSAGKDLKSFI